MVGAGRAGRRRWPAGRPGWPVVACGVGCGGPMTGRRRRGLAAQHPGWRGFPLRRRAGRADRAADVRRQRRQGAGAGRGWVGAAAGRARLPGHGGLDRASAAGSCSTVGCSTGGSATPGTSATSWSSPTAGRAPAAAGAAWRPRRRARPSPRSPADRRPRPPPEVVARTGTLVGRAVASVANLLDLDLAVVAGSVALGLRRAVLRGGPTGDARSRARLSFSAGRADRPGRARAPTVRWSGPARWAGGRSTRTTPGHERAPRRRRLGARRGRRCWPSPRWPRGRALWPVRGGDACAALAAPGAGGAAGRSCPLPDGGLLALPDGHRLRRRRRPTARTPTTSWPTSTGAGGIGDRRSSPMAGTLRRRG